MGKDYYKVIEQSGDGVVNKQKLGGHPHPYAEYPLPVFYYEFILCHAAQRTV